MILPHYSKLQLQSLCELTKDFKWQKGGETHPKPKEENGMIDKYLEIVQMVGNEFAVDAFLNGEISLNELAEEVGSSNADLVKEYRKNIWC